MKKHSILKVLLVVIMCTVSIFTFVACDTDSGNSGAVGDADGTTEEVPNKDSSDDDNQGGGNAGGSETGDGNNQGDDSGSVKNVSAKTVVNQSIAKMETSFSAGNGSAASLKLRAAKKPVTNTYDDKATALLSLYDVYQAQYKAQYFVNFAAPATVTESDEKGAKFGEVYEFVVDMGGIPGNIYAGIKQTDDGVRYDMQTFISAESGGVQMYGYQLYSCDFVYDYETNTPTRMTLTIKQYQGIKAGGGELIMCATDFDLKNGVVNDLQVVLSVTDGGDALTAAIDDGTFTFDEFNKYDYTHYSVQKIPFGTNDEDYYSYQYNPRSQSSDKTYIEAEIDDTFIGRYNEVYSVLKESLKTAPVLNTENAILTSSEFYNYMYSYSVQAIYCMAIEDGKVVIHDVKNLETMKTIVAQLKNELATDPYYNGVNNYGSTYTNARAGINAIAAYLDTIDQEKWVGYFDAGMTLQLDYNGVFKAYSIYFFKDSTVSKQIAFTIDSDGNAKLARISIEGNGVFETTCDPMEN